MSPRFLQLFHTLVEILSPPSPPAPAASPRSSSTFASPCAVVLHSTNAARPHEDLKLRAVRCLCALLRTRSPVAATSGTFHLPAPRVWPLALTVLIVHVMSCVGVAGQPPFIASKSSLALSAYGISLLMDEATTAVNRDLRGTSPTTLPLARLCQGWLTDAAARSGFSRGVIVPVRTTRIIQVRLGFAKRSTFFCHSALS